MFLFVLASLNKKEHKNVICELNNYTVTDPHTATNHKLTPIQLDTECCDIGVQQCLTGVSLFVRVWCRWTRASSAQHDLLISMEAGSRGYAHAWAPCVLHHLAIWDRARIQMQFSWTAAQMDGTETNRRNCAKTEQQKMLDSGGNQNGSTDRVTLKKEIGLLSACAIIIGERYLICHRVRSNQLKLSLCMFLCLSFCITLCFSFRYIYLQPSLFHIPSLQWHMSTSTISNAFRSKLCSLSVRGEK